MEKKFSRNLNNPFIALKHKNFKFYWIGFCFSVIGTWMQNIAQPWLAYSLTNSPFLLSMVGVVQTAPLLILSTFGGVIIDRYPKKKIILLTQFTAFIVTLTMAILTWFGLIQYWHILIGACIMGINNSIDMPARQSFYIELVGKNDLMNAIALCSSAFNIARIIGPLIAGFIIAYVGTALCFFINSISFAVMLLCLSFISPLIVIKENILKQKKNIFSEITEGINHIKNNKTLLYALMGAAIIGTFAFNFNILLPVLVKTVLKTEAKSFSFLMSFMGIGSFTGAMIIASTSKNGPKKFIMNVIPLIIGVLLCSTGVTDSFLLIGLILLVTGLFSVLFSSSANSTMQLSMEENFRGRVMSIYILVFNGSAAFGNFFTGVIMEKFNVQTAYLACGFFVLLFSILLLIFKKKYRAI